MSSCYCRWFRVSLLLQYTISLRHGLNHRPADHDWLPLQHHSKALLDRKLDGLSELHHVYKASLSGVHHHQCLTRIHGHRPDRFSLPSALLNQPACRKLYRAVALGITRQPGMLCF